VLLVFGVALTLRLAVLLAFWSKWHWLDGRIHDSWNTLGITLAESGTFGYNAGDPSLRRSPVFQVVAAGLYTVFGERYAAWSITLLLLDSGTCVLITLLARRAWGERAAVLAGLYAALHIAVAYYTAQIEQFTIVLPLLFAWIWLFTRWSADVHSRRLPLALGIVSGLLVLTKTVYLLFPVAGAAAFLWCGRRTFRPRAALPGIAAFLAISALVVLPWAWRNYQVSGGRFVPVQALLWENLWANVYWDDLDQARGTRRPDGDMIGYIREKQDELIVASGGPPPKDWPAARKELYEEDLYRKAYLEWLPGHIGSYAMGVIKNVWQFWCGAENRPKTLLFFALQVVPLAAALAGLAALVRLRMAARVWCALVAVGLLWSQYTLVLSMGRYSLDLVPAARPRHRRGARSRRMPARHRSGRPRSSGSSRRPARHP
jgi:4-amino-4-deoxy-L-arabinose transferase-like glycosyltransferase